MQLKKNVLDFLNNSKFAYIALFVVIDLLIAFMSLILASPFYFLTSNYDVYLISFYVAEIISSLIVLNLYLRLYGDKLNTIFKCFDLKETIIISIPLLIYPIFNLIFGEFNFDNILLIFIKALASAIMEEIVYRCIIIPHYFRNNDGHNLIKVMLITSIVFAVYHMFNIYDGNDLEYTLLNIISAFGFGIVLSAVLIRSGSIIPLIVSHFLTNFIGFMKLNNSGLINSSSTLVMLLITIIMIVYALYLTLKDSRDLIDKKWKKRWNINV